MAALRNLRRALKAVDDGSSSSKHFSRVAGETSRRRRRATMGALSGEGSPIGEARFARLAAFPRKRGKCWRLNGHLRAQFHHAARRDGEEVGGVGGVLGQEDEQLVLP